MPEVRSFPDTSIVARSHSTPRTVIFVTDEHKNSTHYPPDCTVVYQELRHWTAMVCVPERSSSEVSLIGQTILILEDEPLIARDIAEGFEHAGASVVVVHSANAAIQAVEVNKFSAAILDGMLGGAELHRRLTAAGVPYMIYSGYVQKAGGTDVHVNKPASRDDLLIAIKAVIDVHAAG